VKPVDFSKAAGIAVVVLILDVLLAVAVVICYAVLDGASVGFIGFFTVGFGITMMLKLVAGLAGAQLAVKSRPRAP
jgi:hypothetical protein